MANTRAFYDAAKFQRACAMCGRTGSFNAHHVVYEQELKRVLGVKRGDQALYDPRNARRLCDNYANDCHMRHHALLEKVKTTQLTDDNIAYALEVLGVYGVDYLRRHYDDSDPDPRLVGPEVTLGEGLEPV